MKRKTTQKERAKIAEWTLNNQCAYAEAAKHFDVTYGQVYSWVKKYKEHGHDGLCDRRGQSATKALNQVIKAQKEEIARLQTGLAYLAEENARLKGMAI